MTLLFCENYCLTLECTGAGWHMQSKKKMGPLNINNQKAMIKITSVSNKTLT